MKRSQLIVVLVGFMAIVAFANPASAMYNPGTGTFLQRDPGAEVPTRVGSGGMASGGHSIQHDPYADGMNLYQYVKSSPHNGVDPNGTVVIVIHGVRSDGAWTSDIEKGLKQYWTDNSFRRQDVLRFTWGPDGETPSWTEASDAVKGLGKEGKKARDRLKLLTDGLRKLFEKHGCKDEPINVIAHSQGTIITLGALASGGKISAFVALGSPLDAEHGVIDVSNAGPNVGHIYNYWSSHDGWAWLKGGGMAWTSTYSIGGWFREKKTWKLPGNVTQKDVSPEVDGHGAFQTEALAKKYYGANTASVLGCCDRDNVEFRKEYDDLLKKYLQRP